MSTAQPGELGQSSVSSGQVLGDPTSSSGALKTWATGVSRAEALLVSIGSPRLQSIGIELPSTIPSLEHKLYLLLTAGKGDAAPSAYNALIRRLVSFERAGACVN